MNLGYPNSTSFFPYIVAKFSNLGIPYMVTGSMGCTIYGDPRSTNDVDIVIDPTMDQLLALITDLEPMAYVSREAAIDEFRRRGMFNIICNDTMEKIDLIFLKRDPYQINAFERRVLRDFGTTEAISVTAEDAILSKLAWSRRTLSEVQFRDVAGILTNSAAHLDLEYLKRWGTELNLLPRLKEILGATNSNISLD